MKTINFSKQQKYFSYCLVLVILLFLGSCKKEKVDPNRKVLESHMGEIVKDTRFVGDKVVFKIYYKNISNTKTTIGIIDVLDDGLKEIVVNNGGTFNTRSKTIIWKLKDIDPGTEGSVSFSAKLADEGRIVNHAQILIDIKDIENIKITSKDQLLSAIKELKLPKKNIIKTNSVSIIVWRKPKTGWIPFIPDVEKGSKPVSTMKDETTQDIMINFDVPGMFAEEVSIDGITYHQLSIPFHANNTKVGMPAIPVVGRIIEVPMDVNFTFEVYKKETIDLKYYNIIPAQEKEIRQRRPVTSNFKIDKSTYLTSGLYPREPIMIDVKQIGIIRGHRILFLKTYPVQFDPITKNLVAYSQLEIKVKYSKPAQITKVNPRIRSDVFEALLQKAVINYKENGRYARDEQPQREAGCDYLIITHGDFFNKDNPNDTLLHFAEWKRQKGYITKIVDIANITNGQTAEGIRSYIQSAYKGWYPIPTYILLVGDAEFIPTNYTDKAGNATGHPFGDYNSANTGTDLYYTTIDGSDHYPDIFLGRISVDTKEEARGVIQKILDYEQNPPATPVNADYYTNVPLVQLFEDTRPVAGAVVGDGREEPTFRIVEFAEEIRDYLQDNAYTTARIYDQSGNFGNGPLLYENGTNLPNNLTIAGGFPWNGGTADIRTEINNGSFLAIYDGHGSRNGWARPSFQNANATALANGNLTPVVFSLACETGWFDNETDDDVALATSGLQTGVNAECFCESMLRNNNGGTVGIIGASRVSYEENDFMMLGMVSAVWPDFDPNPPLRGAVMPEYFHSLLKRMGQINNFSKIYMANAYEDDELQFELYHVFGDPEMMIWTEVPSRFKVDFPEGIGSTGEQDFVIKVKDNATMEPVNNAQVSLTMNGALIATKQTNSDGVVRFTLSGVSSGYLTLTVVANNYIPFSDKIIVSASGAQINRLDPEDGTEGMGFYVGGKNFLGNETVNVFFGSTNVDNTNASGGEFGQSGVQDFEVRVPNPYDLGPVNVLAKGNTSNRYGVNVFYVRTANPIDLYTYCQWSESTWHLQSGNNPVWNNPEIQLYDEATNNSVESNNLVVGNNYKIRLKVHNDTDFDANNVKVTFKWANFGIGQPDRVWEEIESDEIDVPRNSIREAEVRWTPGSTGHLCIKADLYHIEDINTDNNYGQENCHVGPTSSPARITFRVWNPTNEPAMIYLELRQHLDRENNDERSVLWGSSIVHPDPQLIKPGDYMDAEVIVDPDLAEVKVIKGQKGYFTLSGFINGKMIGGIDFEIVKK